MSNIKPSYKIAFFIAMSSILWIASGSIGKNSKNLSREDVKTEDVLMKVSVRKSKAELVKAELVLRGQSHANRYIDVKTETKGRINKIFFDKGALLKSGDIIADIDIDARLSQKEQAKSLLKQREIELLAAAKLSKKAFVSKVKLAEAKALRDQAAYQLERVVLDIEHTKIKTPFKGVLENRYVELGDFVDVGTKVAKIVDLDPIKIVTEVSELNINDIKKGSVGYAITMEGQEIDGFVSYISPVANSNTRTYKVEIEAPNRSKNIKDGMTLEVKIPLKEVFAHKIPASIMTLNEDGEVGVKVVDEKDVVHFYPIKIVKDGIDGTFVSGLPNEVNLIFVGQDFVSVDSKVMSVFEKNSAE